MRLGGKNGRTLESQRDPDPQRAPRQGEPPRPEEIAPALLAASRVIVDVLEQAATIGDLHHAIAAGVMTREAVAAELGAVVAGRTAGRTTPEQTIVFDSTGMALQDVAAAAAVYERAVASRRGVAVPLGSG